jgi:dTDP-4-amino-4,6-dideoxygalactose transaminase
VANSVSYGLEGYHNPGFINEVGFFAAAMLAVVGLFILAVIGSRYILLSSKRLSPRTRNALRVLSGLARPSRPKRRQGHRERQARRELEAGRGRSEPIRLKAASTVSASSSVEVPGRRHDPNVGRGSAADLSLLERESWPHYAEEEIEAVVEVLRSGKVNQWTGTRVFEFERAYAREVGNGRAIALANGSVALELTLRAFGVGPGDEVIVTPRSFVASASCVRLVGATPIFADVDRDSGALTADGIRAALTGRTKAIIPVHLGGWPADMIEISQLARDHGLFVIEDCAQAHGAEIGGRPVGSFGHAAAFSFCQDKIISTGGEGGLAIFRDQDVYERAWSFKDHGKNRVRALEPHGGSGFRWLHDTLGTNWRMTEIEAAIGLLQLRKLPEWRTRRNRNAAIWAEALRDVPGVRVPELPGSLTCAYYKFYAYVDVDPAANEVLRDRILAAGRGAGLRIGSGSCSEIHREAAFTDLEVGPLPIAKALGESSMMFEVHPTLDLPRQHARAEALAEIVRKVLP